MPYWASQDVAITVVINTDQSVKAIKIQYRRCWQAEDCTEHPYILLEGTVWPVSIQEPQHSKLSGSDLKGLYVVRDLDSSGCPSCANCYFLSAFEAFLLSSPSFSFLLLLSSWTSSITLVASKRQISFFLLFSFLPSLLDAQVVKTSFVGQINCIQASLPLP